MIKNEHQYRMTRKLATDIQDALALLPSDRGYLALKHLERKAFEASLKRQLRQYETELDEYDSLKSGNFDFGQADLVRNVPQLLIKMRIARGIKQEDLAKRLNLKKQQIQHYEATDYASASLTRLLQVVEALTPEAAVRERPVAEYRTQKRAKARKTTTHPPSSKRKGRDS